jgi:hypothetical protein
MKVFRSPLISSQAVRRVCADSVASSSVRIRSIGLWLKPGNAPRWTATFGQHLDVRSTESDKSEADRRNRAVFYENC